MGTGYGEIFERQASWNDIIGRNMTNLSKQPKRRTSGIVTLTVVESSMIHAVGYDEQTRRLEVVFNTGHIYCYEDVPRETFEGLLAADSKGSYMRSHVMDVYNYRQGPCD